MTKIVAVAITSKGMIFTKPAPTRHHNVLNDMSIVFGLDAIEHGIPENQGFLTSEGVYVGREEAAKIAIAAGQITKTNWGKHLFSEDLW